MYIIYKSYFSYHSDSGHEKAANPHRILAVLLYLNDVDEGGETLFLNQGVSITPKAGRLVFFPTAFTFVHAGRAPKSGSKYVVINFLTT
jgi:Rps23 Pro-64 3,4-dihydroxylase Tpa1-like proline 4-hydroxylase